MRELLGGLGVFTALLLLIYLLNASAAILSDVHKVRSIVNDVINYGDEGFKAIKNGGNLSKLSSLRNNISKELSSVNKSVIKELVEIVSTLSKYLRSVKALNQTINSLNETIKVTASTKHNG